MAIRTGNRSIAAALRRAAISVPLTLVAEPLVAQDDAGQTLFNNACRTCHTVEAGDNRLGPHLQGIVGRPAGSLTDYGYSQAMQGSGIVWDEANLDRFIESPDAVIPGNNMKPYAGMASAEDRATIIAYLKTVGAGAATAN